MSEKKPPHPTVAGFNFEHQVPEGDDRERLVCSDCGFVHYLNPKIVVGSVCTWEEKILMCRRAIEPRKGYWTIPAGYLEEHETTAEGAQREAQEEACAEIAIRSLLGVYNIPRISQVQLIYKAELVSPDVAPGPESLEVALVEWDDIPWEELAFPSVHWALHHFSQVRNLNTFVPFSNPEGELGNKLPQRMGMPLR